MGGESTFDRHRRILAVATGLGTVIFALLASGTIAEQAAEVVPWVYIPLAIAFCGLPVLLIPLGAVAPLRAAITIARVHTVVALLVIVTWLPAMTSAALPGDRAPWVLNTLAVAAATAVIGWSARTAWTYVIALSVLGAVLRYLVLGDGDFLVPLQDGISMLGFCLIISTILIVTLRAGSAQDEVLEEALTDARTAAELDSRARQRARFGSLVHDEVITTLLAAVQTGNTPAVRESAERALRQIDEFVDDADESAGLAPASLAVQLRSSATEIATGVRLTGDLDAFAGLVPAPVALALTGALAEAVRNSVRHEGASRGAVRRELDLAATPTSVRVSLSDDGPGFDPRRVAAQRLGIRTSIVARMSAVGGRSDVSSTPGVGTTIELEWVAP